MHLIARYRRLIEQLLVVEESVETGVDPLIGALEILVSVTQFIDNYGSDRTKATKTLDRLTHAVRDTLQGGKPALFVRPKKNGKPANISTEIIRGTVAAAVNLLILWGEGHDEAADIVCKQTRHMGITLDSKEITQSRLLRWRNEMNTTAPELAKFMYVGTNNQYADADPSQTANKAWRRSVVQVLVKNLVDQGF